MMIYDAPLALYIHLPWCIQKCPYCDFNSHALKEDLPENAYIQALCLQLDHYQAVLKTRGLISIFIGGGTPSLFSPKALEKLLHHIERITPLPLEITLEANPGTFEQEKFKGYRAIGINRLSLGIQSFDHDSLKRLGRIHDGKQSTDAILHAKAIGFDHINTDIMYALPNQSLDAALLDLQTAIDFAPDHLSWYQLTFEPNTAFYHQRPTRADHDTLCTMMHEGQGLLQQHGYEHYEVSAFAKPHHQCLHNSHVWNFGDYLGIGAGAHSKISDRDGIHRWLSPKHPKAYLKDPLVKMDPQTLSQADTCFDYMLNVLRLQRPVSFAHFNKQTGLDPSLLHPALKEALAMEWITWDADGFCPTPLGRLWLDDLTALFLPKDPS